MIVYRKHGCSSAHRTWTTKAKCIWKRAASVRGNGQYAVVTSCRTYPYRETHVQLFATLERALEGARWECGGACHSHAPIGKPHGRGHKVVKLDL